ncbi:porphobilinogen synthase [Rhabdobacter roseus]|uniref:Delta-aminolevulinic acid dehydratase n=1 Tax=Rhabdobacter roseus TaxID=1655419 RepID=A0A840TRY3_9BACT|nr:porphobilinogen synthase [Rhabdobacter roseus]MBB5286691.1 porphobilinogen synthase [Rhabdobacter roseus]
MTYISRRPRRNRKSAAIRGLVQETTLSVSDLIFPMFVQEGSGLKVEIKSMPGIYRFSLDTLLEELQEVTDLGIQSICLFPNYPEDKKDKHATESHREGTLYLRALSTIKERFPDLALMTDIAMDPYSSDGHDGLVENGEILNDATLEILGRMALAQARAGADILGPSDMMDGRVGYLRDLLDDAGFSRVSIMSYSAKYASAFYGPFRDALESAPRFGDKKTYQMNPANVREALVEAQLDFDEGADFLMVKPALSYLDVIRTLHENFDLPIAAYNVSGEYAMLKAAAQNGWLDGPRAMLEVLLSIRRAGAKVILTYFAKEAAELLQGK